MRVLSEGTRLADRYVLHRRLGVGGMAELWLARDERADTVVALKFLKPELAMRTAHRELFHKEWQIGSRLMHAHIARVFEFHDDDEAPFYALQYVDGPEIGVLANETLDNALRPFGLIADALRYAHGKALVHRDIKASNVLLDQRGAPYLLDFGIAAAGGGGSPINRSPGDSAGGTAEPSDDIYALGVLLHEIITGAPPARGLPVGALARPSGEQVPAALQALVRDMLATDAALRPIADEVRDRLSAAGFEPGPAHLPARYSATATAAPAELTVETVKPLRRAPIEHGEARSHVRRERHGASPAFVYGGLGLLLLLFVGVIFVLPDAIERDSAPPDDGELIVDEGTPGASAETSTSTDSDGDATPVDSGSGTDIDGENTGFSENRGQISTDDAVRLKIATDEALGDLLSQLERLKYRGIERWGGQPYLDTLDVYAEGDQAYLNKNYRTAGQRYRQATRLLEPFFGRINGEFQKALEAGRQAFDNRDFVEAIRNYDLAVAITPGNREAERGLARARNLEAVLDLMDQGRRFRAELELDAARLAFEKALELDPEWQPAKAALEAITVEIRELTFQMRMTEGLEALAAGDFDSARAAFNAAKRIEPASREPTDGLLQVDQELRLFRIRVMEDEAEQQEMTEQWEAAVATYEALLEVDGDLQFAQEGLARSRMRAGVHRRLQAYIDEPDSLAQPGTMQQATQLLLDVSRMNPMGPRLEDQKDELSRLLKRAATPLPVRLVSDNATEVSIYRVGKLGSFATRDLSLRPGSYVAVGIRPGYRDVRLEFRVAPEIEREPIVVQCEEPI